MTERPDPDAREGQPGHDHEDEQEAYRLEQQEELERDDGEGDPPARDRLDQ
jgi:hypothetical protein